MLMLVRLDHYYIGAGPATVVSHIESVKDIPLDKDGCKDRYLRVWEGTFEVGARVHIKGIFERIE